jgi:hypothetical protein
LVKEMAKLAKTFKKIKEAKKAKIIVCGLALFLCLAGFTQWQGTEYTINEDTITMAWDAVETATSYKVRAVWIDPAQEQIYGPWETQETQYTFQRPRAGHFRFEVAACNGACSTWAVSSQPEFGQVDGVAEGWRIYWRIAPPTGPVIE